MAFDEDLAERVRALLIDEPGFDEKKMFGGLCFLLNGNMACGINGDRLMIRFDKQDHDQVLAMEHVSVMDFTKKPMRGFAYVESEGLAEEDDLRAWVDRCAAHAEALPPKQAKA